MNYFAGVEMKPSIISLCVLYVTVCDAIKTEENLRRYVQNGDGSVSKSSSPTVTAEAIGKALLKGRTGSSANDSYLMEHYLEGIDNVTTIRAVAYIDQTFSSSALPEAPSYFWDRTVFSSAECAKYQSEDRLKNVSVCPNTINDICTHKMASLGEFAMEIFYSDGQRAESFYWNCPHGTFCCDFECCVMKKTFLDEALTVALWMGGLLLLFGSLFVWVHIRTRCTEATTRRERNKLELVRITTNEEGNGEVGEEGREGEEARVMA